MTELIALRNTLMCELDGGIFDLDAWAGAARWAEMMDCLCIKAQLERYIAHYASATEYAGAVIR